MISVLVPFRSDNGQRDILWNHCRKLWSVLPVELVIGEDPLTDHPFSFARGINNAASKATGNIFIVFGADQLPDWDRIEWAAQQLETHQWCALYANTTGYGQTSTNAILSGYLPDRVPHGSWAPFCTGIIAVRAESWVNFDERFEGWGGEDVAWRMTLEALYGPAPEPTGTLKCLFHEPASKEHTDSNYALIGEYMTAVKNGTIRDLL